MTQKGFSLVEIIVVLSLISVATGILVTTFASAHNDTVLEEAQMAVTHALEGARNRAASGVDGLDHGVRVTESELYIFTGEEFESEAVERVITLPQQVRTDKNEADIVFKRIIGAANEGMEVDLTSDLTDRTVRVIVNEDGFIKLEQ